MGKQKNIPLLHSPEATDLALERTSAFSCSASSAVYSESFVRAVDFEALEMGRNCLEDAAKVPDGFLMVFVFAIFGKLSKMTTALKQNSPNN